MNFGIAGFLPGSEKRIKMAKNIGYDFVESCLFSLHDDYSEVSIKEMGEFLKSIGMPCVAMNGMFPKRMSILGQNADLSEISEYLHAAFEKTKWLNASVCVLGSGRSRKVPDDYPKERAAEEFLQLLCETVMPICKKYDKTVVIEPLSYYITNVVNTVSEAVDIVKKASEPRLLALADFFHVSYNKEDVDEYVGYGKYIGHVHIASFNNKFCFPRPYDGDDYKGFISFLRRSGYESGNISVEAANVDFESEIEFVNTLSSSLAYMRGM